MFSRRVCQSFRIDWHTRPLFTWRYLVLCMSLYLKIFVRPFLLTVFLARICYDNFNESGEGHHGRRCIWRPAFFGQFQHGLPMRLSHSELVAPPRCTVSIAVGLLAWRNLCGGGAFFAAVLQNGIGGRYRGMCGDVRDSVLGERRAASLFWCRLRSFCRRVDGNGRDDDSAVQSAQSSGVAGGTYGRSGRSLCMDVCLGRRDQYLGGLARKPPAPPQRRAAVCTSDHHSWRSADRAAGLA